jgi:hypothetical protein
VRTSFTVTALFLLGCVLLALASPVRRVGDGVEYWAMAEQLRGGSRPSATRADLARLEVEAQRIGHGFEQSPVRFPGLVGRDGRQDFPHFWLYPLVNVPALACVSALGVHPNWAFTLTNLVLLTIAFAIVARCVSVSWAVLLLAGPLIWWVDKAHGDVFTVSLLAIACAVWAIAPGWTMVMVACAAAQNPALMPVWVLTVALVMLFRPSPSSRILVAAACSAAIVAMPLIYYQHRLGVWSPLIGYTHPTWPSMRAMLSLLADPNIGLVPNAPFVIAAAIVVGVGLRVRVRVLGRGLLLAAGAWILLLAAFAQSVNFNHGATPGINRWTLWLTPWLLLIALIADRPTATPTRLDARVLAGLAVLNVVWAVWFFRPALPEVYRYPTMTASWLWTHAAPWYAPAPEIFAERVSHREPAALPVAWPGCTRVLIVDGRWPAACIPTAHTPASCLGPDRLCYVTSSSSTSSTTFTPLGVATFPWLPSTEPTWPGNAAYVAVLREELATLPAQLDPADDVIRAANHVRWTTAWSTHAATALAIYAEEVTPQATLDVRVDAEYRGQLIDLDNRRTVADITVTRSTAHPSVIALPFSVQHALLRLWRYVNTASGPIAITR